MANNNLKMIEVFGFTYYGLGVTRAGGVVQSCKTNKRFLTFLLGPGSFTDFPPKT
jgi:hypothetical protein